MRNTLATKLFTGLAVAGLAATAGSAYTASNTVATSKAGTGIGVISGYAVTDVSYTFAEDETVGLTYDKVVFTLSDVATTARARINTTANGTFANCSPNGATTTTTLDWTCTLSPKVSAKDAVALEVVATNAAGTNVVAA